MILITGAAGLIGNAVLNLLRQSGCDILGIDKNKNALSDILCVDTSSPEIIDVIANNNITGVIHLAAVSRVVDAQNNPDLCFRNNVQSLSRFITLLANKKTKPWIIFASSREVYGQSSVFPVTESAQIKPLNVYGYSKWAGESICMAARDCGMRVLIARFSSVYGWAPDHATRVVPAFIRGALQNEELQIEGSGNIFDFTHIDDVAKGVQQAVNYIQNEKKTVSAFHFVSGQGTTLGDLSKRVIASVGMGSAQECPPRNYDVHKFIGDPALALQELGWKTEIDIVAGIQKFIPEMKNYLESGINLKRAV